MVIEWFRKKKRNNQASLNLLRAGVVCFVGLQICRTKLGLPGSVSLICALDDWDSKLESSVSLSWVCVLKFICFFDGESTSTSFFAVILEQLSSLGLFSSASISDTNSGSALVKCTSLSGSKQMRRMWMIVFPRWKQNDITYITARFIICVRCVTRLRLFFIVYIDSRRRVDRLLLVVFFIIVFIAR